MSVKYRKRLPTNFRYLSGCILECLNYAEESQRKLRCTCADGERRRGDAYGICHSNMDDANDSSAEAGSDVLVIETRERSLVAYTASVMLLCSIT
jgi:hypothetical protein